MAALLGMDQGTFPIRYLGVPLVFSKLSVHPYKPLIDTVLARIRSWTVRSLTYAGRLTLLKAVLRSLHVYWAQVFLLPTKVMNENREYM